MRINRLETKKTTPALWGGGVRLLSTAASGEESLHLLRRAVQNALWVLVAAGRAHHGGIHLPVGSADQLHRLLQDLLPVDGQAKRETTVLKYSLRIARKLRS